MKQIKRINSSEEKEKICQEIVNNLPDWFDEKGRIDYVDGVKNTDVWAAYIGNELAGFISIKLNSKFTSEIYVFGVLEKNQRNGIGSELLAVAIEELKKLKVKLLIVKTLDNTANYEPYERTRNFYLKNDFFPIDVYKKIWNEDNPCLLMGRVL